jgi:hypothetical protein
MILSNSFLKKYNINAVYLDTIEHYDRQISIVSNRFHETKKFIINRIEYELLPNTVIEEMISKFLDKEKLIDRGRKINKIKTNII